MRFIGTLDFLKKSSKIGGRLLFCGDNMGYFLLFLFLSLVILICSQPREVLNEIWNDIEEYERTKRVGFKQIKEETEHNNARKSKFIILFDLLFFVLVVCLFGSLGYLLGLIS